MTTFVRQRGYIVAVLALLLTMTTSAAAQQAATSAATQRLTLTVGRSTVLSTDFDVTRIAVTDPAIANATVVEPRSVLVDGKAPGTITLLVWGENQRRQFDLAVEPAPSNLQAQLQALFPGEAVAVNASDEAIVLSGRASSPMVAARIVEIARASSAKLKVVNLLQLPEGSQNNQVLLQVRFAEVNRRAITELGASFFTSPTGVRNTVGRVSTEQFPAPSYNSLTATKEGVHWWDFGKGVTSATGSFTFSDFLNLFLYSEKYDLGVVIKALQEKGLFESLAEPNLVAYNGQEASFLAGGEIPIPIVQGVSGVGTSAVTITFKEFGVRLNFTPTIIGDTIRLHVRPEVSSLDYSNGIILSGFRIPALSSRHAETDVELRDGQSYAIAGLIDNTLQDQVDKVPGLGDIPIIGKLFQSKSSRKDRTELMVVVTPHFVRPLNPNEVPALPALVKPFLAPTEGGAPQGGPVADAPPVNPPNRPQGGER